MQRQVWYGLIAIGVVLTLGCSSGGSSGTDGGTDGGDDGSLTLPLTFSPSTLDWTYAGKRATIDARGATLGIAYYRVVPDTLLEVTCPPTTFQGAAYKAQKPSQDLMYIEYADGAWKDLVKIETTVTVTLGLSFVFSPTGSGRYIGYLGGAIGARDCASSDAMIARSTDGTTWTREEYGDSSTVPNVENVAGPWTSVAVNSAGEVFAAYRDTGLGTYQGADLRTADLRFGRLGTDTSTGVQNTDNGAGEYNFLLFDAEDNPVILQNNSVDFSGVNIGLQVARRQGTSWGTTNSKIIPRATTERPGFATNGQGRFAVAYYDPQDRALHYTESTDLQTWSTPELVDTSGTVHGYFAFLAFDSQGNPGISYYRCGLPSSSASSCDPSEDGVLFAAKRNGQWQQALVDDGGSLRCGEYTSVTFNADDEPIIAYQCGNIDNQAGGTFVSTLKAARGVWQ